MEQQRDFHCASNSFLVCLCICPQILIQALYFASSSSPDVAAVHVILEWYPSQYCSEG